MLRILTTPAFEDQTMKGGWKSQKVRDKRSHLQVGEAKEEPKHKTVGIFPAALPHLFYGEGESVFVASDSVVGTFETGNKSGQVRFVFWREP